MKLSFSEKASKIWKIVLTLLIKQTSKQVGNFFKFCGLTLKIRTLLKATPQYLVCFMCIGISYKIWFYFCVDCSFLKIKINFSIGIDILECLPDWLEYDQWEMLQVHWWNSQIRCSPWYVSSIRRQNLWAHLRIGRGNGYQLLQQRKYLDRCYRSRFRRKVMRRINFFVNYKTFKICLSNS